MFRTKSRTEQLQDQSASLASTAATVADQLRDRVVPAVGQAAENAIEWGQPRVEAAREWARPRVEHGIEVAAPRLESAVSGLAPKVDTARDKIVDELIPRIADAIAAWSAASAAAKDEAVSRGQGAAAVISGNAVASRKRKKKGRVLLAMGMVAATGAAAMAFMKKSAPKDDPWTTPLADPYVELSNGRHSDSARVDDMAAAADQADSSADSPAEKTSETQSEIIESLDEAGAPSPLDPLEDGEHAGKDGADGEPKA